MKLSDGEKLGLLMLSEIYDYLKLKGNIDTGLIRSAIYDGHLWGLEQQMSGVFHGSEPSPEVVSETTDILWMWDIIESSLEALTPEAKKKVAEQVPKHLNEIKFRGFDGNSEGTHYSVADFKIDKLGQFSRFKSRDLNSHLPLSLERQRRMYAAFEPFVKELSGNLLNTDQIVLIIKAGE